MQWIKSHLTLVICGSVSLVAVALVVLGFLTSSVQETLAQDANLLQNLISMRPVNERVVRHYEKLLEDNTRQIEQIEQRLAEQGTYQPLHPDVFPDINPANMGARFLFGPLYLEAQRQLVALLKAGQAPTDQEKKEEAAFMADQKAKAEEARRLGVVPAQPARAGPGGLSLQAAPPRTAAPFQGRIDSGRRRDATPEELADEIPDVRISIRRAREIYCYATPDCFGTWPGVSATRSPKVEDMWYAQMGLWIQQDVTRALAGLNNRVADELNARRQLPWVGTLPLKRIKRFVIHGYAAPAAAAAAQPTPLAGPARGGSAGETASSFTRRTGSERQDVILFTLELVVDARMLPAIVDEICKAGFFTPVNVNYTTVPPNLSWSGYLYGSGPVIEVTLDFEGSFLRSKYEQWMPPAVKTEIAAGNARVDQGFQPTSATVGPGPRMLTPTRLPGREDED